MHCLINQYCMQMSSEPAGPVFWNIPHMLHNMQAQMTMRLHNICLADAKILDSQADNTAGQKGST